MRSASYCGAYIRIGRDTWIVYEAAVFRGGRICDCAVSDPHALARSDVPVGMLVLGIAARVAGPVGWAA